MEKVELSENTSGSIDEPMFECYNTSVAGACTQALDPTEVHLSFDAPGWVAESLRTSRTTHGL